MRNDLGNGGSGGVGGNFHDAWRSGGMGGTIIIPPNVLGMWSGMEGEELEQRARARAERDLRTRHEIKSFPGVL